MTPEQRAVIDAAKAVRDSFTFKMGGVLDETRRCLPWRNERKMRKLDDALRALEAS